MTVEQVIALAAMLLRTVVVVVAPEAQDNLRPIVRLRLATAV
jgi:hypothetical protein